jgi:ribonuclease HI
MALVIDETAVNILVDGSAKPNPGQGGVGLLLIWADSSGDEHFHDESLPYAYEGTTNNRMEIQAVIDALKFVMGRLSPADPLEFGKIVIHTDSLYVYDNHKKALFEWPGQGWRNRHGKPVLNAERWKELRKLIKDLWGIHRVRVDIKWTPGKRDPHTKRVDRLAKASADSSLTNPDVPTRVRRKWSPRNVEAGNVRMRGQQEIVRVVTDQYLQTQKVYRVKYEIIDAQSDDFQNIDFAFSDHMLSAGHLYRVLFNDDDAHPQIADVLEEFPMETYALADYRAGIPGPWVQG